jgi:thiamine-phosphate diphosphorylase
MNVEESDGTLILNEGEISEGTLFTKEVAIALQKEFLVLSLESPPPVEKIFQWLKEKKIYRINIAGPRESKRPGIYLRARHYLAPLMERIASTLNKEFPERALDLLKERGVYLLLDPGTHRNWLSRAKKLYRIGIPWFQIRAKGEDREKVKEYLIQLKEGIPDGVVIANDDPDLAFSAGVDGVHVGPLDPSPLYARGVLGCDKIVGSSGDTPRRLTGSMAKGVTYFGVGTFRKTPSKPDGGKPLGVEGLKKVASFTPLPKVAVGGILPEDLPSIRALGYIGVAVFRGIWLHEKIYQQAERYLTAWQKEPPSLLP